MRTQERFRRTDFGHMTVEIVVDDPGAYTKPWSVTIPMELMPDTELIEDVCDNEKDAVHNNKKLARPCAARTRASSATLEACARAAARGARLVAVVDLRDRNRCSRAAPTRVPVRGPDCCTSPASPACHRTPQIRVDVRPHQPRPHGPLVVSAVAIHGTAFVMRLILGVRGIERAQPHGRQEARGHAANHGLLLLALQRS